jgi:hypothetical protein
VTAAAGHQQQKRVSRHAAAAWGLPRQRLLLTDLVYTLTKLQHLLLQGLPQAQRRQPGCHLLVPLGMQGLIARVSVLTDWGSEHDQVQC